MTHDSATSRTGAGDRLDELERTVDALLDPPGCEWNRAQTHASLVTYLVEESFELVEAVESGTDDDLREELGDVLYQVVLNAGIAARRGAGFDLSDVVSEVEAKIRRRHPHVFGDESAADVDDIVRIWSAAKAVEKAGRTSALDGVPLGLPALARVQKVAARAERAGLTTGETADADAASSPAGAGTRRGAFDATSEAEWGRRLLAEVDVATDRGWDAERALRTALREREGLLRKREIGLRESEQGG